MINDKIQEKSRNVTFKVPTRTNLLSLTFKLQNSYSTVSRQKVARIKMKNKYDCIIQ